MFTVAKRRQQATALQCGGTQFSPTVCPPLRMTRLQSLSNGQKRPKSCQIGVCWKIILDIPVTLVYNVSANVHTHAF